MLRYFPLLLLAGFAAEIASIIWVGRAIGVFGTLLLMGLGVVGGVLVLRATGASIAMALRRPSRDPSTTGAMAGVTFLRAVAAVLLVVPGFFSDVVAGLLLIPLVQSWLVSHMKIVTVDPGSPASWRCDHRETVIEGEAIEIQGEIEPPPSRDEKY